MLRFWRSTTPVATASAAHRPNEWCSEARRSVGRLRGAVGRIWPEGAGRTLTSERAAALTKLARKRSCDSPNGTVPRSASGGRPRLASSSRIKGDGDCKARTGANMIEHRIGFAVNPVLELARRVCAWGMLADRSGLSHRGVAIQAPRSDHLTGVAAAGGCECAQALASLVSTARSY